MALLEIKNLTVEVNETSSVIVDHVEMRLEEGKILSIVGESGSGKSTTGYAILGLLDPALTIRNGAILFSGEDLVKTSAKQMQSIRGGDISMIFQEPLHAFNPVFSIGYQMDEMMRFHTKLDTSQRRAKSMKLLDLVGLPKPDQILKQYPHQLSGGMRQRAMIAQAIAAGPKMLIADEPTSSLDVTLQAKIMALFKDIREEFQLSIILITHDLGMAEHLSDETIVMCEGRVVEQGLTRELVTNPQEEYTQKLLQASRL